MEPWRQVFREGFAKIVPLACLEALRDALERDSTELVQEATTVPAALLDTENQPCEGGCLVSYAGWKGGGLKTVGEVERCFSMLVYQIDRHLGQAGAVRPLLNWFDTTPRDEMRRQLLPEVRAAIEEKEGGRSATP